MPVWTQRSEWDALRFLWTFSAWPLSVMSIEIQEKRVSWSVGFIECAHKNLRKQFFLRVMRLLVCIYFLFWSRSKLSWVSPSCSFLFLILSIIWSLFLINLLSVRPLLFLIALTCWLVASAPLHGQEVCMLTFSDPLSSPRFLCWEAGRAETSVGHQLNVPPRPWDNFRRVLKLRGEEAIDYETIQPVWICR